MRTVEGRTDHVVVVGAGLAGLSAALHLLGAGRRDTSSSATHSPVGGPAVWTGEATGSTRARPC